MARHIALGYSMYRTTGSLRLQARAGQLQRVGSWVSGACGGCGTGNAQDKP
jgi:hypothetical protein